MKHNLPKLQDEILEIFLVNFFIRNRSMFFILGLILVSFGMTIFFLSKTISVLMLSISILLLLFVRSISFILLISRIFIWFRSLVKNLF